ncbi:hypothetical protein [Clostridium sp. AN503]|uniref:hypothetical protein n=1 Tax=Clostridium sp. AN503 TaxID=3160598 RepID=UPI00345A2885
MTINELQRQLIAEIEQLAKEVSLVDKAGKPAMLKGYQQAIPIFPVFAEMPYDAESDGTGNFREETDLFPYFIVRIDTVEYQKPVDGMTENLAHVMIAFAIYDDDEKLKGYYSLTAIMERVVGRFQNDPILGQFWCNKQMNMAYQEDDTYPQFFGALEMMWNLPQISRGSVMEEFL